MGSDNTYIECLRNVKVNDLVCTGPWVSGWGYNIGGCRQVEDNSVHWYVMVLSSLVLVMTMMV